MDRQTRRSALRAAAGLLSFAGAACAPFGAPQAAESPPVATGAATRAPVATAVPPTPVPPTPTPEPTPTPGPEPEEWAGTTWRGRVDVTPREARQGATVLIRVWSSQAQDVSVVY